MQDEWYYRVAGRICGPAPFSLLAELVHNGRLHPTDEVRSGVSAPWRKVADVARLADTIQQHTKIITAERVPPIESDAVRANQTVSTPLSSQWYYKVAHETHGPYHAQELMQMAQNAMVLPQDYVRCGNEGLWSKYILCQEQIEREARVESGVSDDASVDSVGEQTAEKLEQSDSGTGGKPLAQPSSKELNTATSLNPSARKAHTRQFLHRPQQRFTLPDRIRANWGIMTALAVLLTFNLVAIAFPFEDENVAHYLLYQDLSSRMQQLRDSNADANEWTTFSKEAHKTLSPILTEFTEDADVRNPVNQHLLWAGRDYLLPMIDACLVESKNHRPSNKPHEDRLEKSHNHFRTHMAAVEQLLVERR